MHLVQNIARELALILGWKSLNIGHVSSKGGPAYEIKRFNKTHKLF